VPFQFPEAVLDGGPYLVAFPGVIGKLSFLCSGAAPFGGNCNGFRLAAHLGRLPPPTLALHIIAKDIEGFGVGLQIGPAD
jgi:hypothetical protein